MNAACTKVDRGTGSRAMSRIGILVGVLLAGAVAIGAYIVVGVIHVGTEAEERLQSVRMVGDLIAEHVERSPTHAWPASWGDLEKLPHRFNMFGGWPAGSARVQALVKVDFTVTTAEVLKQTPETCTAVTVTKGPRFEGCPEADLVPMFERLRVVAGPATPGAIEQGRTR